MAAVAAMLEAGVNVNSVVDEQGTRPLLCAASMGNIDVVRMLAVYPGVMLDIPVSLILQVLLYTGNSLGLVTYMYCTGSIIHIWSPIKERGAYYRYYRLFNCSLPKYVSIQCTVPWLPHITVMSYCALRKVHIILQ